MFVAQNNRNLQRALFIFPSLILLCIILACAKIGSPLGGPKDEDPPVVMKTKPPENSVNYSPDKNIEITFDEYIQLQDIYQELIISPPLEEKPTAQLKGKSVVVKFPDEAVFDTTTYTLSFGHSIVDNNESNVLQNYEFVFSLKDYLDSMNVEGKVISAFNHTVDEESMFVMLYKNLNDSAPLLEKPRYICRTDKEGNFSLHNLENGHYRLFALKDFNSNLIFDLAEEQIAFHDSIIELTGERFRDDVIIQDTVLLGLVNQQDSVLADTTVLDSLKSKPKLYSFNTQMFFFTQEVKNQYMVDYLRRTNEQLFFTFNEPLKDSLGIAPLNFITSENWYLLDANDNHDTLIYWLTDTSLIGIDTLSMEVEYSVYDSMGALIPFTDTLLFIVQQEKGKTKQSRKSKKKKDDDQEETVEKEPVQKLKLNNNIKNPSAFDLNKQIIIKTQTPCFDIDMKRFQMYFFEDTLERPLEFTVQKDTNSFYQYCISYQGEELTSYKIVILDSALTDIYGHTNDTTLINFTTQAADFYGILSLNLTNITGPIVMQLMDEAENIISQKFLNNDQRIRYEYLPPKKYKLKVIIDSNNNGKWDTGHYLKGIQPEKVIYFPQEINVRSNWEVDFSWQIDPE